MSKRPRRIYVLCFSISFVTSPMNSRGVDLQHFRPRQGAALVNCLKSFRNFIRIFRSQGFGFFITAGHIDNGECVFENFAPEGQFIVQQKKKVRLVDLVGCGHVESWAGNSLRRGEEYLPEGLLNNHFFAVSSGTLAASANSFYSSDAFPVSLRAVVYLGQFTFHRKSITVL